MGAAPPASSVDDLAPIRPAIAVACLLLFFALAALHTWPLASAPGTLSRNDNGDAVLHEWIMAWVAHQVVSDPWHLFDANIFFPEPNTLAFSDHLFAQSMLGAPLRWAGASPVLVHNLVLIAGLALSGWTACLVIYRWTGRWSAGLLSGCLMAFNAFTLTRLPQIQDLHLEFFAPALLALDRLLRWPRLRHGLLLALWYVLQSLTGTYLMVFTAIALISAVLARPRDWIGAKFRPLAPPLMLAVVVSTIALLPFILPYYRAREAVGLGRSLEETRRYSAEFTDYLVAPGTLYFEWMGWGRTFWAGDALFPGVVGLLLAILAVSALLRSDARVRMLTAIGVVAFALSFGPSFPLYKWLYYGFPLLQGIRGAVRFGEIVLAAIALLAGFGLVRLLRHLPRRAALGTAVVIVAAVNLEALRAPMFYSPYRGIPPVYDALTEIDPTTVVVWFPFYNSAAFHQNAPFMLAATRTFNPMLNGYSGFKPASYYEHVERLTPFPDRASIDYLRQLGVGIVMVDSRNMRGANLTRLDEFPELRLWKTDGNLRIYCLSPFVCV